MNTPGPAVAAARINVGSEIGPLEAVICHSPGPELLAVTPSNREHFLYGDILDQRAAHGEHARFRAVLARYAEVYDVADLLGDIVDLAGVRDFLIARVVESSSSDPIERELYEMEGSRLVSTLIEGRRAEPGQIARMFHKLSYDLPPLPNLFFTRDAAMVLNDGVLVGSMRHAVRWTEELLMKALFTYHPSLGNAGLIYDGSEEYRADYTVEGGDVLMIRPDLAMIGLSERSSPSAIEFLAGRLHEKAGVEHVIVVVLPARSPAIHLDMIFTMVDRDRCVVYPPYFDGPGRLPVLHFRTGRDSVRPVPDLFELLAELDLPLTPIFCGGTDPAAQEREQWASGCNFVAVRPGVILGYSRNEMTLAALEAAGYRTVSADDVLAADVVPDAGASTVITFDGGELVRGGGGARCMTLPVRRGEVW